MHYQPIEDEMTTLTVTISDIFGMLKRPGQPTPTIEDINEVIADSWAGGRGDWPQ